MLRASRDSGAAFLRAFVFLLRDVTAPPQGIVGCVRACPGDGTAGADGPGRQVLTHSLATTALADALSARRCRTPHNYATNRTYAAVRVSDSTAAPAWLGSGAAMRERRPRRPHAGEAGGVASSLARAAPHSRRLPLWPRGS